MRDGLVRDWILRGVAIVFLALIALTSYWYSLVIRKPQGLTKPPVGAPDFVVNDLTMTQFDDIGRAKYRLFAQTLRHFGQSEDIVLTEPRLVTLYPDRPQVDAQANHAQVDDAGTFVLMTGAVRLIREARARSRQLALYTETLNAWPEEDRYATGARGRIERGTGTAVDVTEADQVRLDNARQWLEFEGQVQTMIAPTPGAKEP